jgi:hypothetical protein
MFCLNHAGADMVRASKLPIETLREGTSAIAMAPTNFADPAKATGKAAGAPNSRRPIFPDIAPVAGECYSTAARRTLRRCEADLRHAAQAG